MKSKFLKNLLLLLFLNLLIKPLWIFGIDRNVQNMVGSQEYGLYFSLFNFSLLFTILLDLGITNYNNRSISQDKTFFEINFIPILVARFFLAVVYAVIAFCAAGISGYDHRQISLLGFLLCNQFLATFLLYLRSNISGLQYYTTDSLLSVLDRSIMIVLSCLLLFGKILNTPFRIEYFVYVQTLAYALAIVVIGIILFSKSLPVSFAFPLRRIPDLLKRSLPFAILGFLMAFYNRIDSVLLERLLPKGAIQAGIYAQSFRILDAASNFSMLFAALLLPMFSTMLGSNENIRPLLKLSFTLLLVLAVSFSMSCFAFSEPIIRLLYREGNAYSASVFSVLAICFVPLSLSYIFGTLLTASGNLKFLNLIAIVAVVINVLLNLVLIRPYQAFGAAIASLITQTFVVAGQIVLCIKLWKLKPKRQTIIRYLLFFILSTGATMLLFSLPGLWLLRFIGCGVSIGCLALIVGVVSFANISEAIRFELKRIKP